MVLFGTLVNPPSFREVQKFQLECLKQNNSNEAKNIEEIDFGPYRKHREAIIKTAREINDLETADYSQEKEALAEELAGGVTDRTMGIIRRSVIAPIAGVALNFSADTLTEHLLASSKQRFMGAQDGVEEQMLLDNYRMAGYAGIGVAAGESDEKDNGNLSDEEEKKEDSVVVPQQQSLLGSRGGIGGQVADEYIAKLFDAVDWLPDSPKLIPNQSSQVVATLPQVRNDSFNATDINLAFGGAFFSKLAEDSVGFKKKCALNMLEAIQQVRELRTQPYLTMESAHIKTVQNYEAGVTTNRGVALDYVGNHMSVPMQNLQRLGAQVHPLLSALIAGFTGTVGEGAMDVAIEVWGKEAVDNTLHWIHQKINQLTPGQQVATLAAIPGFLQLGSKSWRAVLHNKVDLKIGNANVNLGVNYKNFKTTEWTAPKGTQQTYKVHQRKDIDWDMVRTSQDGPMKFRGKTNREAALAGKPPELSDGSFINIHHIGQNSKGPLVEASTKYHNKKNKQAFKALHNQHGVNKGHPDFPVDHGNKWRSDVKNYWKNRGKNG